MAGRRTSAASSRRIPIDSASRRLSCGGNSGAMRRGIELICMRLSGSRISDRCADRGGDLADVVLGDAEVRGQPQAAPRNAAGVGEALIAAKIRRLAVDREPETAHPDAAFFEGAAHPL